MIFKNAGILFYFGCLDGWCGLVRLWIGTRFNWRRGLHIPRDAVVGCVPREEGGIWWETCDAARHAQVVLLYT